MKLPLLPVCPCTQRALSAALAGRVLAVLTIFTIGLLGAPAAQSQAIAVPSYVQPGSKPWLSWAAHPQAVKIMIVNLNNGDDTNFYPSVLTAVELAQASGIKVLGYTYTDYGQRDPNTVQQRIAAAEGNYGLDGVFLDEAPTSCSTATPFGESNLQYYQNLASYVHSQFNGTVVMNPGTPPATDCWMSAADILVIYENSGMTNYQHRYSDMPWVHNYPAGRFWNLVYGVSKQKDMQTAFKLAQQRNIGLIYVTSDGGSNPWDAVPSYWTAEVALK